MRVKLNSVRCKKIYFCSVFHKFDFPMRLFSNIYSNNHFFIEGELYPVPFRFCDCKINPSKYCSNKKFFVRWQKGLRSLNNSSAESPSECFITNICQEKILTKSRKIWQIIANTHNTSAGFAPGYQKVVQVKGQRKLLDLYIVII